MGHGRRRESWLGISAIMAHMANMERDPNKRADPYTPGLFDIYDTRGELKRPRPETPAPPLSELLRAAGVKHNPGK